MKEQDAGLLKVLGPLAGDAVRLSGYDKSGVSVALNPVDSKILEVSRHDRSRGFRFGKKSGNQRRDLPTSSQETGGSVAN